MNNENLTTPQTYAHYYDGRVFVLLFRFLRSNTSEDWGRRFLPDRPQGMHTENRTTQQTYHYYYADRVFVC